MYQGADKSVARPGRKQARKHVSNAHDFNNIEMRAVIKFFFPARQGAEGKSSQSDRNISLFPSLSALRLISTPICGATGGPPCIAGPLHKQGCIHAGGAPT